MSTLAFIGFGSNLGDRKAQFDAAVAAVRAVPQTAVLRCSSLYETEPVGLVDNGPSFLNAVVAIETTLSPDELMGRMRSIELDLGKSSGHRSDLSRQIDLDLLLYGEEVIDGPIRVPHPRMHQRAFVLAPLAEIAPKIRHPVLNREMETLLLGLPMAEREGVRPWQPSPRTER